MYNKNGIRKRFIVCKSKTFFRKCKIKSKLKKKQMNKNEEGNNTDKMKR